MKAYACYNTNEETRLSSSSGGVFSLLAEQVLADGGIVYGCAMTQDCYGAELIRVSDERDLRLLRGSKYLQAKMGDILSSVKSDLHAGKLVLFSGTGCQINGLKRFLQNDYDNLLCVDLICHGVPSPSLWKMYVQYREKHYGKIKEINFRYKSHGWKDFGIKVNHRYISKDDDPYMQMFLEDKCLRPSCYVCMAKKDKESDITLADFWKIENVAPEMNDGKGVSLVLVRTERGKQMFEEIRSSMVVKEVDYAKAIDGNPAEYKSVERPSERDVFFIDMNRMSFDMLAKKYTAPHYKIKIRKIKRLIKRLIQNSMYGGEKTYSEYGLLFTVDKRD